MLFSLLFLSFFLSPLPLPLPPPPPSFLLFGWLVGCFDLFIFSSPPTLLLDQHIAKRVPRLKTRQGQQDPTSMYAQTSNDCPDIFGLYDQAKYIDSRAVTAYTTACSFTLKKRQAIFLASLAAVLLWQTSSHILHYCIDAPQKKKKEKKKKRERQREREKTDNLARTEELRFEKQPLLQDCTDIPSQTKTGNLAKRLEPKGATC